jgi:hypothetical protein
MNPQALRNALDQLGMSGAWLARACGRSPRTGHAWLTGATAVPAPVAAWLLRRLGQLDMDPPPQLPPRLDLPKAVEVTARSRDSSPRNLDAG